MYFPYITQMRFYDLFYLTQEIILLKPEGDAKIQTIMSQAESSKAPLAPKTLTDIKNQWDNTLHLANTYLR